MRGYVRSEVLTTESRGEERKEYVPHLLHVFGSANAGYLHTIASLVQTVEFLRYRLTPGDVYDGTVDVARVVRGQEDEGGGKFDGLTRAAHR